MQLKHYASRLRRHWWLVVGLPLVVAPLSLLLALQQPQHYSATVRLMVTQAPRVLEQSTGFPDFNLTHSWMGSVYILDDIPQVVSSRAFAADVSAALASRSIIVAPETVQASLHAETMHRAVTIATRADTPERAEALAAGAAEALQQHGLKYWDRATGNDDGLRVAVLDPARATGPTRRPRDVVEEVGLRTALALAAGVGLAFVRHYLDDTIRDRQQAETWIELHVVGVIPRE
jgi:capsular polysaccharide biosynthesis protein